ncbi:MAG: EscF/YscF/HrpA family type III secretion system needle major subunit [Proteobacteria bacterium]|jgi:type III secretion protein F|nr:EscF/YscF/HrpA family type III secretion system needle major subunit [Pseudomonadota bacterium]
MATTVSTSTGINFSMLSSTIGSVLTTSEGNLRDRISNLGENPTQTELLMMQADLQKWSMLIQLQSTITKELGDALKGIIQKAA